MSKILQIAHISGAALLNSEANRVHNPQPQHIKSLTFVPRFDPPSAPASTADAEETSALLAAAPPLAAAGPVVTAKVGVHSAASAFGVHVEVGDGFEVTPPSSVDAADDCDAVFVADMVFFVNVPRVFFTYNLLH